MFLLILDSLGGTELLVILVVALIVFGPKKLPQLSRSLGKSLAEFKRASREFQQTWEREAALANFEDNAKVERAMLPPEEGRTISATVGRGTLGASIEHEPARGLSQPQSTSSNFASSLPPPTVRTIEADPALMQAEPLAVEAQTSEPESKRDWL